jgi:hypothetical protein
MHTYIHTHTHAHTYTHACIGRNLGFAEDAIQQTEAAIQKAEALLACTSFSHSQSSSNATEHDINDANASNSQTQTQIQTQTQTQTQTHLVRHQAEASSTDRERHVGSVRGDEGDADGDMQSGKVPIMAGDGACVGDEKMSREGGDSVASVSRGDVCIDRKDGGEMDERVLREADGLIKALQALSGGPGAETLAMPAGFDPTKVRGCMFCVCVYVCLMIKVLQALSGGPGAETLVMPAGFDPTKVHACMFCVCVCVFAL